MSLRKIDSATLENSVLSLTKKFIMQFRRFINSLRSHSQRRNYIFYNEDSSDSRLKVSLTIVTAESRDFPLIRL